jgi:hypothetical protein
MAKLLGVTTQFVIAKIAAAIAAIPSVSLTWAALADKPTSTVANIDLAVGAKHTHDNASDLALVDGTNTGDQTSLPMSADDYIRLSGALADGKYCGITEQGIAGHVLAFGDLVYFSGVDSRWELVDADAEATSGPVRLGICVLGANANGDPVTVLTYGKVRKDDSFPDLTIGAPVYASTSVGDIQVAQPTAANSVIRIIGYGTTINELFFCPSNDYIVHV